MASSSVYPRVIVGGWQLSSGHHATFDRKRAIDDVIASMRAGLYSFDMGDIYTGVEALIGDALSLAEKEDRAKAKVNTKLVPDLDLLAKVDEAYVRGAMNRSLSRLGVPKLDLVQFHWWDWSVGSHVEAYRHLVALQKEGLVGQVGLTNYDGKHVRELLDAGLPVSCVQCQYSLLDTRAAQDLAPTCEKSDVSLLCYGALAGGFLTEKWLGAAAPDMGKEENRSLTKYHLIIDECGGWDHFQGLLRTLKSVATKRSVTIAAIAIAWVLRQKAVASVILGARSSTHIPATLAAARLELTVEDINEIDAARSLLKTLPGPVYGLERQRNGPHGACMRYNLNQVHSDVHLKETEERTARLCAAVDGHDLEMRRSRLLTEVRGFPSFTKDPRLTALEAKILHSLDNGQADLPKAKARRVEA